MGNIVLQHLPERAPAREKTLRVLHRVSFFRLDPLHVLTSKNRESLSLQGVQVSCLRYTVPVLRGKCCISYSRE